MQLLPPQLPMGQHSRRRIHYVDSCKALHTHCSSSCPYRFSFLTANGNSRDTLKVTWSMLSRILTFHQVMPNFLDFISVFGKQDDARDITFSSFQDLNLISRAPAKLAIDELDRTANRYQLCYNLKSVATGSKTKYSIRQAAVHHQFDIKEGKAFWIFAQGHWDLFDRLNAISGPDWRERSLSFGCLAECFGSTLTVHKLACEWACQNWRKYIVYLEVNIKKHVSFSNLVQFQSKAVPI